MEFESLFRTENEKHKIVLLPLTLDSMSLNHSRFICRTIKGKTKRNHCQKYFQMFTPKWQCHIVSKLDGLLNPERDLLLITGGETVGVKTSEH